MGDEHTFAFHSPARGPENIHGASVGPAQRDLADPLMVGEALSMRDALAAEHAATGCPDPEEFGRGEPKALMAFDAAVSRSSGRRLSVCFDRSGEYQDSWAIENVHTPRLDAILKLIGLGGLELSQEERRLIVCAALADVKTSRYIGGWKDDTAADEGNYLDALADFVIQYREKVNR